jgi:hypothetical protein
MVLHPRLDRDFGARVQAYGSKELNTEWSAISYKFSLQSRSSPTIVASSEDAAIHIERFNLIIAIFLHSWAKVLR